MFQRFPAESGGRNHRPRLKELPQVEPGVLNILQKETKDLSGAILSKLCQKAHKLALREYIIDKKKNWFNQLWRSMNHLLLLLKYVVPILKKL